jgi:ketosteroid isomerase-like protein
MSHATDERTSAEQIVGLERAALDRWGSGDPGGFLELYAPDVTYFDPLTSTRFDGHQAMVDYYDPWTGKIHIVRYEMLHPHVVVEGSMALLTYNLVNYIRDAQGGESVGSRWNSTVVYQHRGDTWKTIHSHWSYTRHPAFQNMSGAASEGLEG